MNWKESRKQFADQATKQYRLKDGNGMFIKQTNELLLTDQKSHAKLFHGDYLISTTWDWTADFTAV